MPRVLTDLIAVDDVEVGRSLRQQGAFQRRFASSFAGGINFATAGVALGEYLTTASSQNIAINGRVILASSQNLAVIDFLVGIRTGTFPAKVFTISQRPWQVGGAISSAAIPQLKVYEDPATGRVCLNLMGTTGAYQNMGWRIDTVERGNYDGWTNNSSLVAADVAGLTEFVGTATTNAIETGASGAAGPTDLGGTYPDPIVKAARGNFTVSGQLLIPTTGALAGIVLGADALANLYRGATAGNLYTDGGFKAAGNIVTPLNKDGVVGGNVGIFINPSGYIIANRSLLAANFLTTVPGETAYRFSIRGDGRLSWSDGISGGSTATIDFDGLGNAIRSNDDWAVGPISSGLPAATGLGVWLDNDGHVSVKRAAAIDRVYMAGYAGNTSDPFSIYADGKLEWGPGDAGRDVTLYRPPGSAGAHQLKTDDMIWVAGGIGFTLPGDMAATGVALSTGFGLQVVRTSTANALLMAAAVGDTGWRFRIDADGRHYWGDSAGSQEIRLARSTTGLLALTGSLTISDDLTVSDALTVNGKSTQLGVIAEKEDIASPRHLKYRNLVSTELDGAAATNVGAWVIQTTIKASTMFRMRIEGQMYESGTIPTILDLELFAYAQTTPAFARPTVVHHGSRLPQVRFAFNAAGEVAIILGDVADQWAYPRIDVPWCTMGYVTAQPIMSVGWTVGLMTDLSSFTNLTVASDASPWKPSAVNLSAALVVALPSSPYDGQEVYYVADSANNVIWNLRYRLATLKWEFVGGSTLYAEDLANRVSINNTPNYTALATALSVTAPLAGTYEVEYDASVAQIGAGTGVGFFTDIAWGANIGNDQNCSAGYMSGAGHRASMGKTRKITCAAGDVVSMVHKAASTNFNAHARTMTLKPIAVS